MTIDKKVDANWFIGSLGDRTGIFPISYVQIIEGKNISHIVISYTKYSQHKGLMNTQG